MFFLRVNIEFYQLTPLPFSIYFFPYILANKNFDLPCTFYFLGLSISRTGINGHQSLYSTDVLENAKDSATSLFWYLEVYPQLTPEMRPLEIIQEPG